MRRWLWLHLTRDGRDEHRGAKRYGAMLERARTDPAQIAMRARIKACSPHPNRTSNPHATGLTPQYRAETCMDCGVGVVTRLRWQDIEGLWHHPECFACWPDGCCCDLDCKSVQDG